MAYYGLIQSDLIYGILSGGHAAVAKRLFGQQRRAIRVIWGINYKAE